MGFLSTLVPASIRNLLNIQTGSHRVESFRTFTESAPSFTSFDGTLYEQALCRSIVERFAVACSKLKPEFVTPEGSLGAAPRIQRLVESWPNDFMTWPDFLRRLATILYVDTTAYVVPQYDRDLNIIGLFPLKPTYADVVEYDNEPYIIFHLSTGETQVFWFYEVAILTRFQLDSDIFGGGNFPLTSTLRLLDAQRQAEELALQNGARIRFIGKLAGLVQPNDMDEKREKFGKSNLSSANTSGLMVYDNTWESITQIKENAWTIDSDEMERLKTALYTYFGTNEHILTNDYTEEQWGAWYEGCVEPFAIMLGEALTKMLLTPMQRRHGNRIMFSSSYLEYATPKTKQEVIRNLAGMSLMTVNEARDVMQLPSIPGGDVRLTRGEYYLLDLENNVLAESGGISVGGSTAVSGHFDEPPTDTEDDVDAIDAPDDGQERSLQMAIEFPELALPVSSDE